MALLLQNGSTSRRNDVRRMGPSVRRDDEDAFLDSSLPPPKTIGKTKGGTHVQGSVFAQGPRRAGDRRIARHRQDDRGADSSPGRGEGLHHRAQGRACEATAKELTGRIWRRMHRAADRHFHRRRLDMLAAEIIKREPKLDILVNNAGRGLGRGFRRISGKRLGQGDGPQRQDAVLPDQGAGQAAARGGHRTSGPPRSSTSPRSTASSSTRGRPIPTPRARPP